MPTAGGASLYRSVFEGTTSTTVNTQPGTTAIKLVVL
jgi:hypothetical protein